MEVQRLKDVEGCPQPSPLSSGHFCSRSWKGLLPRLQRNQAVQNFQVPYEAILKMCRWLRCSRYIWLRSIVDVPNPDSRNESHATDLFLVTSMFRHTLLIPTIRAFGF